MKEAYVVMILILLPISFHSNLEFFKINQSILVCVIPIKDLKQIFKFSEMLIYYIYSYLVLHSLVFF